MPNLESICYKNSYLYQVIFKIDFSSIVPNDYILDSDFDKKISEIFNNRGKDKIKNFDNINLTANKNTGKIDAVAERFEGIEREYYDNYGNKFIINNSFLAFDFRTYSKYDDIRKKIIHIIVSFWKDEIKAKRVGLRYINLYNVNAKQTEVKKNYFSSGVSNVMVPSIIKLNNLSDVQVTRSLLTSEYLYKEIKIIYKAGLINRFYPMPIVSNDYVVDIDCSNSLSVENSNDVESFLDRAHLLIQTFFEASINNKMRETMI